MDNICDDCGELESVHQQKFLEQVADYATLKSILEMVEKSENAEMLKSSLTRIITDWRAHVLPACSELSLD